MKKLLHRLVLLAVAAVVLALAAGAFVPGARAPLLVLLRGTPLEAPAGGLFASADRIRGKAFDHARTPGQASEAAPAPLALAVSVTDAVDHLFRDRLFVSGSLVPREEAMVGPQIESLRVVEVLAEDGDRVEAGQVLARLDRSQLDTQAAAADAAVVRADAAVEQAKSMIAQYEATSAQADADLARSRRLEAGVMSQAALDQRQATARAAAAQLAAARNALAVSEADRKSLEAQRREVLVRIGRTEVRAPVAGLVSRRTARLGALASSAGEPLFRIVTRGEIDLDAEAPDDALQRVRVGMPAAVVLIGGGRPVEGAVRLVSSEVDKATRLGRVRIALPADAAARIGAFASGTVTIDERRSVAVPATAVTGEDGRWAVGVVKDDRVEMRTVETGLADHDLVEIRRGLAAGETIVARAGAFLRDGDSIRPVRVTREASR